MSRAGFEPASANTVDLKSTPLDLSGTVTGKKTKNKKQKTKNQKKRLQSGSNR